MPVVDPAGILCQERPTLPRFIRDAVQNNATGNRCRDNDFGELAVLKTVISSATNSLKQLHNAKSGPQDFKTFLELPLGKNILHCTIERGKLAPG